MPRVHLPTDSVTVSTATQGIWRFEEPLLLVAPHGGDLGANKIGGSVGRRATPDSALPVLIVDDDVTFLSIVAKTLDRVGWSYVLAEGGLRALESARQQRFRAVLLDLGLPDVDGLHVLRTLRNLPNPPVVVLVSGGATIRSVVEAMKLGAQDFIEKPAVMSDLIETLAPVPAPDDSDDDTRDPVKVVADLIFVIAQSPTDVRTVVDWALLLNMSAAAVVRRCLRVGVRAKQALDLGRLMRIVRVPTNSKEALLMLDSADQRTLFALLARSGLRVGDLTGLDMAGFLRLQMLVGEPFIVSELLRRVPE